MKTKLLMGILMMTMSTIGFAQISTTTQFVESKGGGGGDASEARVNEIRDDILKWIIAGGPKGIKFPIGETLESYNFEMTRILQPKFVVITFVEQDSSTNEELSVSIDEKPKTCRGFFARKDNTPNIICNISRFKNTSDSDQYRLIHHEYAGLAYLEKNDGAASDYDISNQMTDYLNLISVLKLSVKKAPANDLSSFKEVSIGSTFQVTKQIKDRAMQGESLYYQKGKLFKNNYLLDPRLPGCALGTIGSSELGLEPGMKLWIAEKPTSFPGKPRNIVWLNLKAETGYTYGLVCWKTSFDNMTEDAPTIGEVREVFSGILTLDPIVKPVH